MRRRWSWSRFGMFVVVAGVALLVANAERQNIFDWWRLRSYQAPAVISSLASETTMNAYARKIFYVNHPAIESKTSFTKNCPNNGGEKTVVLGCYHGNQRGIFLLDVSDPRLNGVEQVTAAHEMLHAAYDRLSNKDRTYVNGLLLDYYQHDLQDKRLLDTIAEYKQTEPNDWVNEMHSVLGTEVANLPTPLESYYKRYFTNRQAIAAYAVQYENAFTSRQNQVAADDAQLATWKTQISNDESSLQTQEQTIEAEQTQLNQLKNSGQIDAYNAAVPAYNANVNTYNRLVVAVRNLINQYNQLVAQRNSIALEENQLVLDVTAAPSVLAK